MHTTVLDLGHDRKKICVSTRFTSRGQKKSFWYNAQGRRNRRGARDNFFHILEDCLNMIPSPWPSVKIQIVGAKIAKRDKTALTDLSTKLWFEMKSTKIYSKMLVLESPIFFLTCILPDYVSHEITKEFWKISHFENKRASFLLRCQNSLW